MRDRPEGAHPRPQPRALDGHLLRRPARGLCAVPVRSDHRWWHDSRADPCFAATFGKIQQVTTAGTALVNSDGVLERFDFVMLADQVRLVARGEVKGKEIVMEVDQAGETSTLRFDVSSPPHVGMSLESVIRQQELAVGLEFTVPYFDPLTLAEGEMTIEVVDVEIFDDGEEAYWLVSRFGSVETRSLVTPAGETLRQEGALGMRMVRMTEEEAQAISDEAPQDLIAPFAVPFKGRSRTLEAAPARCPLLRDSWGLWSRSRHCRRRGRPSWMSRSPRAARLPVSALPEDWTPQHPSPSTWVIADPPRRAPRHRRVRTSWSATRRPGRGGPTLNTWVFDTVAKEPSSAYPTGSRCSTASAATATSTQRSSSLSHVLRVSRRASRPASSFLSGSDHRASSTTMLGQRFSWAVRRTGFPLIPPSDKCRPTPPTSSSSRGTWTARSRFLGSSASLNLS